VTPGEAALSGIRNAVEILDSGESQERGTVSGIPVYDFLLRDLDADPSLGDQGCAWLGFGIRHHHGSRWAVRDFLREAAGLVEGADSALRTATECYERVLDSLLQVIRILPGSIDAEDSGDAGIRRFIENRAEAKRCLREARAAETEARDALAEAGEVGEAK
jgi:hypothetical protein